MSKQPEYNVQLADIVNALHIGIKKSIQLYNETTMLFFERLLKAHQKLYCTSVRRKGRSHEKLTPGSQSFGYAQDFYSPASGQK